MSILPRGDGILRRKRIRYFTFGIFTMLPFACGSFGSLTTVTYNSFSPSLKETLVVPSPAAISKTCRSLPSGDSFKILPPNHCVTRFGVNAEQAEHSCFQCRPKIDRLGKYGAFAAWRF